MFQLPRIMGHRGAAGGAPENTLVSLRTAAEQGARWVEFDAMLSGVGVPVLFLDDNLMRTTGCDAMDLDAPRPQNLPVFKEPLARGSAGVAIVESRYDLAIVQFSHHRKSGVCSAEHFR